MSEVDRESERLIVERLSAVRPGDAILAEEGTLIEGTSGVRWVIDPLDGTTNYLYGYPAFGPPLQSRSTGSWRSALCRLECGTLLRGAQWLRSFLRRSADPVREQPDLERSLVATGFSYDVKQRERQGSVVAVVLGRVSDIRRSGAAALESVTSRQATSTPTGSWTTRRGTTPRAASSPTRPVPRSCSRGRPMGAALPSWQQTARSCRRSSTSCRRRERWPSHVASRCVR